MADSLDNISLELNHSLTVLNTAVTNNNLRLNINNIVASCVVALSKGNRTIFAGNEGSAADT